MSVGCSFRWRECTVNAPSFHLCVALVYSVSLSLLSWSLLQKPEDEVVAAVGGLHALKRISTADEQVFVHPLVFTQ